MFKKIVSKFMPLILALIFVIVGVTSISYKSHSRDENRHLVRGVMLLESGDYRLNKHHPILANAIAAVPQLFNDKLVVPSTDTEEWNNADKDAYAEMLIDVNGGKRDFAFNVLNLSRYFMIIVFTGVSLYLCYLVRKERGETIGNLFAFFYFLSPNLIANARLVTTDALVVPLVMITTIFLYRYAKYSKKDNLIYFVLFSFLSLITKYSVVPIAFFWIVSLIIIFWNKSKRPVKQKIGNLLILLGGIAVSWVILLWATYGFRLATLADTDYSNVSRTQGNIENLQKVSKAISFTGIKVERLYTDFRLPFPEYIHGFLENVLFHNASGHDSFLAGNYAKTGWWWYFPFTMLVKMPVTMLIFFFVSAYIGIKKLIKDKNPENWWILAIIPILYLLLSMSSSINLGIRHVLIVFPFIFLFVSINICDKLENKGKKLWIVFWLGWYLSSFVFIYPHYLEYFNEFVGGPNNGHFYLLDSNLSWAQDDFYVEDYIGELEKQDETVYRNPLEEIEEGYIVIDSDLLMGRDVNKRPKTAWLRDSYLNGELEPVDRINYTYLVFKID